MKQSLWCRLGRHSWDRLYNRWNTRELNRCLRPGCDKVRVGWTEGILTLKHRIFVPNHYIGGWSPVCEVCGHHQEHHSDLCRSETLCAHSAFVMGVAWPCHCLRFKRAAEPKLPAPEEKATPATLAEPATPEKEPEKPKDRFSLLEID